MPARQRKAGPPSPNFFIFHELKATHLFGPAVAFLLLATWFLVLRTKQGGNMERSYRNDVDWRDLCEQASKEQDSAKLIEIVQRLNEALEDRRRRPIGPAQEIPGTCDDRRPIEGDGEGCYYVAAEWAS